MFFKRISKKIALGMGVIMAAGSVVACTAKPEPQPVEPTVVETPEPEPTPVVEPVEVEPEPVEEVYVKPEEYFVTVGNLETGETIEVGSYEYVADIHNIKITDLDAFKEQIRQLPNLLYIDMCDCGLTNEEMEDLMYTFPSVRFVWMIRMTNTNAARTLRWNVRTDALAFSTLHAWATDPRLDNDQAQQLKYCTDLVALDFGHNAVHDCSFMEDMDIHILITVDSFNRVENHKFDSLDVVRNFPNLMYLETFVGAITDTECLKDCKEMVDLNLSYNPISDITYLKDFPKLERFVIENTRISYADYQELCACYPDITIYYTGSGSVDHGWRSHPRYFAMIDMFRKDYWNDLFRTEAELEDVAKLDMVVIDGVRYYGTSYVDEITIDVPEVEESEDGEASDDGTENADTASDNAENISSDTAENTGANDTTGADTSTDTAADGAEGEEVPEEDPYIEVEAFTATDKYGRSFTFEKAIQTTVGAGNIPKENEECNFDAIGNVYSTDTGDGKILVLMADGQYHWFYKNEVLARILIEKLDADGELKEEYTREKVEERVAIERAEAEAAAQAAAEEQAGIEAEEAAQAEAEAQADAENAEGDANSNANSTDGAATDTGATNDAAQNGSIDETTPIDPSAASSDDENNQFVVNSDIYFGY